MLQGVIFDLDGVVVDSHPVHLKAWREFLHLAGKKVSDEQLQVVFEGWKRDDILLHFMGPSTPGQLAEYGAQKELAFRRMSEEVTTVPGVRELLQRLDAHHVACAIGSSASRHRVTYLLQHLGLACSFPVVVTGDDVKAGKPDPGIFLLAAKRMGLQQREVVVIEDSVSGVKAARAAGMKCVGVVSNGRAPALLSAGADVLIHDFHALTVASLRQLVETVEIQRPVAASVTGQRSAGLANHDD